MRIDRAQAVAQGIRSRVPVSPEMKAFEYGCGTGLLSFVLQPYLGQITLADYSSGMLAILDEKISAGQIANMASMQIDLSIDPLPTEKYQLIYTLMTLHHIPDTSKILHGFYQMLDTPGYVCIADLDQEDGSFHGPGFSGHQGFNREELAATLKVIGFNKVTVTTVYHTRRMVGTEMKTFPLFLMTAEKLSTRGGL